MLALTLSSIMVMTTVPLRTIFVKVCLTGCRTRQSYYLKSSLLILNTP